MWWTITAAWGAPAVVQCGSPEHDLDQGPFLVWVGAQGEGCPEVPDFTMHTATVARVPVAEGTRVTTVRARALSTLVVSDGDGANWNLADWKHGAGPWKTLVKGEASRVLSICRVNRDAPADCVALEAPPAPGVSDQELAAAVHERTRYAPQWCAEHPDLCVWRPLVVELEITLQRPDGTSETTRLLDADHWGC